jgi:hypothetical protein
MANARCLKQDKEVKQRLMGIAGKSNGPELLDAMNVYEL